MAEILGRAGTELATNIKQMRALILPDDLKLFEKAVQEAQSSATGNFFVEHRILDLNGNVCWVENRGRVFRDETGIAEVAGGISTRNDERKRIGTEPHKQS